MNEEDVRVDVYSPAVPIRPDIPDTWPSVRVTHLPSGLSTSKWGPRVQHNRLLALAELSSLVEEHYAV